ncbi:uncharacterized protein LDX57_012046 [Aspergillus melleus]|nr:uncharacterized protein LDX57_012046 [Aspergillus melleus]KAH8434399.1 hypothetical protein LDX57_012046 [Aspergillus melleus]
MAQLINVRFQQPSQYMPRSATNMAIDRVILEAFIFHTSTSIPFQHQAARPADIDFAFSLAEKRLEDESCTTILDHSHSPILGVPPRLFACIREIALIHQGLPRNVDVSRCYELMEAVSDLEVDMLGSHQLVMDDLSRRDLVYKDASIGPRLYILACKILLDRIISLVLGDSAVAAPQLLDEAIDLVNQLQPMTDYYAEYYGWPFQVLGVCTSLPEHRNCLLWAVTAFWKATRNGTMGRLVRTLACWSDPLDRHFPLQLEDSERMPRHQTLSH